MFDFIKKLFSQAPQVDLKQLIREGAFLVDVRTPAEFQSGNVKGSVNIPLDTIPRQLEKFKGKKSVIVFCRSGNRSSQAKTILQRAGISEVYNGGTWEQVKMLKG
ncbi:MAG: rhodanese-like domain-containing protein [Saprospiraceae bacterium]|nr:rhodanese-like domain-containing protein [Saprospiraceae bacterium]